MEQHSHILNKLVLRKKPDVPEGYFESFSESLHLHFSESEDPTFKPVIKPQVPEGFFSGFYANLKSEIESESAFREFNLVKTSKPEVPLNFFEQFPVKVKEKTSLTPIKKHAGVIRMTYWTAGIAIAASLTLLFRTYFLQPVSTPVQPTEVSETTNWNEDHVDLYASYLDEESVIDYMIEHEIDTKTAVDDDAVYDAVEDDLEEIYLEL